MIVLNRTSDRIKVKIGEITLWLSPLSAIQKSEILSYAKVVEGEEIPDYTKRVYAAIKYSVKKIGGVCLSDGSEYELEFEEGTKSLTEECVNDLLNLPITEQLMVLCASFINGVPSQVMDPNTGKKYKGVEIELPKVSKSEKK